MLIHNKYINFKLYYSCIIIILVGQMSHSRKDPPPSHGGNLYNYKLHINYNCLRRGEAPFGISSMGGVHIFWNNPILNNVEIWITSYGYYYCKK